MIKHSLKTTLYKIVNYKKHSGQQKNYLLMTIYVFFVFYLLFSTMVQVQILVILTYHIMFIY